MATNVFNTVQFASIRHDRELTQTFDVRPPRPMRRVQLVMRFRF